MANFDLNNFVIDRIVRGVALSKTDNSVLFSINQIQNASLNCASESTDAVDAIGVPVATFYRAKTAEFSAENALFDMNLMAVQLGTKKNVASADAKVTVPAMETFVVEAGGKYELKHAPKGAPAEIYALNNDSTFGTRYPKTKETTAAATEFSISGSTISVTANADKETFDDPSKGIPVGTEMFVMYEYETENAVEVVNSATKFPVGCKFVMEVLGCDVCDNTNLIYAYLVFPNFKLSPDFDWSIATDGAHPFSGRAQQDYCDKEKKLFSILVPGDEE
jgi:hypothetical protein